jgi:hypothetical protein
MPKKSQRPYTNNHMILLSNSLGLASNIGHHKIIDALLSYLNVDLSMIKQNELHSYRTEILLAYLKSDMKIEGVTSYRKIKNAKIKTKKSDIYIDANHNKFLSSYKWRSLRMKIIKKYGTICMCCGASPSSGAILNVDHIKPRKKISRTCVR